MAPTRWKAGEAEDTLYGEDDGGSGGGGGWLAQEVINRSLN